MLATTPAAPKPAHFTSTGRFTLYMLGGMGLAIQRIEVKHLELTMRKFAQYESAVSVKVIPRGARKVRGFVQDSRPTLVVLEGWDHIKPDGMWSKTVTDTAADGVARETTRSCFDPSIETDFAAQLTAYLAANTGVKVVADYRGHNPYRAIPTDAAM